MRLDFYSSAFCGSCSATRAVLARVGRLVPAARVVERDVARFPDEAEAERISSTPTVIVRDDSGTEVFRAEGTPTVSQVLSAIALAV